MTIEQVVYVQQGRVGTVCTEQYFVYTFVVLCTYFVPTSALLCEQVSSMTKGVPRLGCPPCPLAAQRKERQC